MNNLAKSYSAKERSEAWKAVADAWEAVEYAERFSGPRLAQSRKWAELAEAVMRQENFRGAHQYARFAYDASRGIE